MALPEFVATLLNAATTAHFMHLSSKSYAAHMALGTFYEELPDLVDAVAEACMGRGEQVDSFPEQPTVGEGDPIEYLEWLCRFVDGERTDLPQDTEIQNSIDEIVSLIDSTLYKLRFLK